MGHSVRRKGGGRARGTALASRRRCACGCGPRRSGRGTGRLGRRGTACGARGTGTCGVGTAEADASALKAASGGPTSGSRHGGTARRTAQRGRGMAGSSPGPRPLARCRSPSRSRDSPRQWHRPPRPRLGAKTRPGDRIGEEGRPVSSVRRPTWNSRNLLYVETTVRGERDLEILPAWPHSRSPRRTGYPQHSMIMSPTACRHSLHLPFHALVGG